MSEAKRQYIALLRGINVGGRTSVAMADLREMVTALGFTGVRTLLQSGNLLFDAEPQSVVALEHLLEDETARQLNLKTDYMLRTPAEWQAIVSSNPFPQEAQVDPGHLLVMFLKDAPSNTQVDALRAAITGAERVQVQGREAYVVYPDGIGRSRLTNTLIEKQLGTRGTGRNWNTVLKVAAIVNS